jgi:uncharacterized protein YegP (UPF0339 family)
MYFSIYKSEKNNQFYWTLFADNNNVIATGGEGYVNKQDAYHGVKLVKNNAFSSKVYDKSREEWIE